MISLKVKTPVKYKQLPYWVHGCCLLSVSLMAWPVLGFTIWAFNLIDWDTKRVLVQPFVLMCFLYIPLSWYFSGHEIDFSEDTDESGDCQ